jgi:hypothetical protein
VSRDAAVIDEIASGLVRVAESLKRLRASEDWVSQKDSPLGRARHLRLVRTGELPGCKVDKLVLVRRWHIDAYIQKHHVTPTGAKELEDEAAEVDALVRGEGLAPKRRRRA